MPESMFLILFIQRNNSERKHHGFIAAVLFVLLKNLTLKVIRNIIKGERKVHLYEKNERF